LHKPIKQVHVGVYVAINVYFYLHNLAQEEEYMTKRWKSWQQVKI